VRSHCPFLKPKARALALVATAMLWLAAPVTAIAEVRDYYFAPIGSERGLAQNSVTAMVQDRRGFVWIATQGGLHRYDGQRYLPHRHDPRDPSSLPDNVVTALALEGDDALWIGTHSRFVSRLDLDTGRIERFMPPDAGSGDPGRQVMSLLPRNGRVWVGSMEGLDLFDPATGRRERVLELDSRRMSSPFQQLLADADGTIWFASAAGLFRVDGSRARLVGGPAVTQSLLVDRDGALWVGRRDGLFRLDGDGQPLKQWPLDAGGGRAGGSDVRQLVQAPDGSLWLSTYGSGLVRFDPTVGSATRIRDNPAVPASLPEDHISSLMLDAGGILWVGGQYRGVSVVDPSGTPFRYVLDLARGQQAHHAAGNSLRAIHEGVDGALWLGTDDARLLRYDVSKDAFDDWSDRLPARRDGSARQVTAIADAGHGRLWLATTEGLFRADPALEGTSERIQLGALTGAAFRTLLVARSGDLWLGTSGQGMVQYQRRSRRVVHYAHAPGNPAYLSHPNVHALLEDRRGRIWIGTGDGLDLLDPATGRLRHFSAGPGTPHGLAGSLVRALHEDEEGRIWVGTHSGLNRVSEQPDGSVQFLQPLPDALDFDLPPAVYAIAGDDLPGSSKLWLATDIGVLRLDTGTGAVRRYGLADGLQDLEFNGGAVAPLSDGSIAFGGVRGLNLFHPARMQDPAYVPPLQLLSARAGADAAVDAGVRWQGGPLTVPDGADILRLRVGALDFAPAASILYRYRLEGFDKGWIDNGPQGDITYTRLPPGSYVLRAQASDRAGSWTGAELRVPVDIAPPLWRHPATIAATLLALLAWLAWLAWQWRQRRDREQGWFRQIREREERLKLALWASGEQFWDYDLRTREIQRMQVSDTSSARPDISVGTVVSGDESIHPEDREQVREAMVRHLRGEVALFLSEHRTRGGGEGADWHWVRARGRVVERSSDGRAVRVAGTARDITANRSAERERRISSEVLRSMAEAVAVFDEQFRFVSVNPAFTRMTGYVATDVLGQSTSLLDGNQHHAGFYSSIRDALQRDGRWSGEVWQQRRDGEEFLCWLQAGAVSDMHGGRGHYVAVLTDITEQKRAEQELRYLANYDPLTSLPNRTLLSERLSRSIVRARAGRRKIAVLFLDLDRFKDINDSLGHAAGDRILGAAARRLQQTVGASHTVARLGGDEFTVVLEDLHDALQAEAVAADLIAAFETPLQLDEQTDVVISPSIGISLYPDHARIPSDLLKHADTAMYQAKAMGRRTFMVYEPSMDIDIRRRATLSAALRKVLDRSELSLVFQPQQSLSNGDVTGVEALLRWHSPELGDILPSQFIPLAEENGLILEIGEWVLQQACATLGRWRALGVGGVCMAVNVSALQLLRGDLPTVVARVLEQTGLPPEHLELELTESVLMANPEQNAAKLQAFRSLGVGLAVDDFGTGYSSLSYLKRLPITSIKIDKEFVDDLSHDPDDAAITSTIIKMAHSLGLSVIAEGVETEDQVRFLRDHRCDEIQGFWLARPMSEQDCLAFLLEHARHDDLLSAGAATRMTSAPAS